MKRHVKIVLPSLILITILAFELLSLTNMNKCDQLNLPLIIAVALFLVILFSLLIEKENTKYLLIKLILNFKGEAGNWYGFFSVLFVIINLNWLGNACWGFINDPTTFAENGTKALIIAEFLFIPFVIAGFNRMPQKTYSKVLISGLSLPNLFFPKEVESYNSRGELIKRKEKKELHEISDDELIAKLNEYSDSKSSGNFDYYSIKERVWGRWDGIQKSLSRHPEIETVVLLPSQENILFFERVNILKERLNENWDITSVIPNAGKKMVNVLLSEPVDVNDIEDTKLKINNVLTLKVLNRYKDEDLLFCITSSTAIVSSAMILNSLKGQRRAEYIHQNTKEICEIDLDVLSVQDLWDEILFKIQEHNSERLK